MFLFEGLYGEMSGRDQIGVGVAAAKVCQRHGVEHAAVGGAELLDEDALRIRTRHGMHRIEAQARAALEPVADAVEVEQLLHQLRVIVNAVNDLDHGIADRKSTRLNSSH